MYSFTLQWCCSSIRHKGKVFIKIHNPCHLPAVSWLWLEFEEHEVGCLTGLSRPLVSLCGLGSIGYSVLSPCRSELMPQVSNPWSCAAFITVVIFGYNRKMGKYWLLFNFIWPLRTCMELSQSLSLLEIPQPFLLFSFCCHTMSGCVE